jgi:hypothetical protein
LIRNFILYYIFLAIYPFILYEQLGQEDATMAFLVIIPLIIWCFTNLFLYLFYKNKRMLEEHLFTHGFYLVIGIILAAVWVIYEEITLVLLPVTYIIFALVIKRKPFQRAERIFVVSGTISLVLTFMFNMIWYMPNFYDDKAEVVSIAIFSVIWAAIHLGVMFFIKVSKQLLHAAAVMLGLAILISVVPYLLPLDFSNYLVFERLTLLIIIPVFQWFFEKTLKGHLVKSNLILRKTILIPVVGVPLGLAGFFIFLIVLFSSGFVPGP